MPILCIDTSTPVCSAGLFSERGLLANASLNNPRSAASSLVPLIGDLLGHASCQRDDLQGVALAKGPGSYTGLRVATSTAKGLCYALNIPLVGIDSLKALAFSALKRFEYSENELVVPMIDARRMEVYQAIYNAKGECLLPTHPHIFGEGDYSHWLEQGYTLHLMGTGAPKSKKILKHERLRASPGPEHCLHGLASLAWERLGQGETEGLAYFEPFYLKSFQGKKSTGHKLLKQEKTKHG